VPCGERPAAVHDLVGPAGDGPRRITVRPKFRQAGISDSGSTISQPPFSREPSSAASPSGSAGRMSCVDGSCRLSERSVSASQGTTRTSLVITVGAARDGGPPALIKTWEEFVAAERARTTEVVALSGSDLPAPSGQAAQTYEFSGIFDGQVRTIMRVPQASDSTTPR
jgi:hypothetical protein